MFVRSLFVYYPRILLQQDPTDPCKSAVQTIKDFATIKIDIPGERKSFYVKNRWKKSKEKPGATQQVLLELTKT